MFKLKSFHNICLILLNFCCLFLLKQQKGGNTPPNFKSFCDILFEIYNNGTFHLYTHFYFII